MADKDYKAFIVEGEAREPQVIDNISKVFFKHGNLKIITLPAGENIYMLWKKLKADDFDTDIIEVLRESNKKIREQLEGLSRDDFSEVFLFFDYDVHQTNLGKADDGDVINQMLESFDNLMRISCLLGNAEVISYEQYLDEANPHDIYICEQALAGNNKVFIISAFPEFLVDYFGIKLWRTCVKHAKNQLDICNCK